MTENCLEPWVEKVVIKATKPYRSWLLKAFLSLLLDQTGENGHYLWSAELLFRGISTGWRSGLTRISRSSAKGNEKSYTWGGITPYHHTGWGIEQLCRKDLGHPSGPLVKHESAVCACGDAFSRCILGCISKNVNSRLGAIIVLCLMLVRLSLGHCIQFGALQKKNLDLLEWIQQKHQDGQRTAVHEKAERTGFVQS